LPNSFKALEPFIDEETMKVHYLKHHQAYTNKLNDALTELRQDPKTKHFAKMGIDSLLQHLDEIPVKLREAIRNNEGGYVNHDKFWAIMKSDEVLS